MNKTKKKLMVAVAVVAMIFGVVALITLSGNKCVADPRPPNGIILVP